MKSINDLQQIESVDRNDLIADLKSEPIETDIGGRTIRFGLWDGIETGHMTMFTHRVTNETFSLPTEEVKDYAQF